MYITINLNLRIKKINHLFFLYKNHHCTRCVCETQMPPVPQQILQVLYKLTNVLDIDLASTPGA